MLGKNGPVRGSRKKLPIRVLGVLSAGLYMLTAAAVEVNGQDTGNNTDIDAFVQQRLDDLDIPGAALAIVRDGEIVHLQGYGTANAGGDPVTPQTPFLLASISKSMTAVAVMRLVEQGKVALEDPVQKYIPWFMPDTPITVRQLLNQTSGLDEGQGYDRNLDPDSPNALEQSIRRLAAAELNHWPGETFEYSNSNYDVLGLLVETVSGLPYGEYIQVNLFEPLGMTHSFTSLKEARAVGMSSAFYPFFGRQTSVDGIMPYSGATRPSAGLFGSVEDVAHYLIMHMNSGRFGDTQVLTPDSVAALHKPGAATNDSGLGYAMGWAVWPFTDAAQSGTAAPIALSHGGSWLGSEHIMLIIPERDLGLVLLLNSSDPVISSAYNNIAFDAALLALGLEAKNFPPREDWLTRHLRPLSVGVVVLLLALGWIALKRLRDGEFQRRDAWLFVGLIIIDLTLAVYLLLIRLPSNKTNVQQVLRFEPDLGLMLVLILLLTIGWGSVRSLWAIRRRQQGRTAAAGSAVPSRG